MFGTLVSIELFKMFSKVRTYISFAAVAVLVLLVQVGLGINGEQYSRMMLQSVAQTFDISGTIINANLLAFVTQGFLLIHVPFLIVLVTGELIAGETTSGTVRLLLSKPSSRTSIVLAKFVAAFVYSNAVVAVFALLALGLGTLLFGSGELLILKSSEIVVLPENDVYWRFFLAYGFTALSMFTITSIALFFSAIVENALGPIMATMAIVIVFTFINFLDIPLFNTISPYLFSTHMQAWRMLFDTQVDWWGIASSVFVLVGHCVVLLTATWYVFTRKDVTA